MPSWDDLIKEDLRQVDDLLARMADSRQPLLTEVASHVLKAGGKRMRPGVALLSYRCVGGTDIGKIVKAAAAFELIHSATLVHDDINDQAEMRRGSPSAHRRYGTAPAIIAGDFLFTQGFRLGGSLGMTEIIDVVADACVSMAESEIGQMLSHGDPSLEMDDYLGIISGKTARLIMASARVGSFLGGGSSESMDALDAYGINTGYAFQIADDILDVVGSQAVTGKTRGQDLMDGCPNLPIFLAMRDPEVGGTVSRAFKSPPSKREEVDAILDLVVGCGAVEEAREHAERYRDAAIDALSALPPSPWAESLRILAVSAADRRT